MLEIEFSGSKSNGDKADLVAIEQYVASTVWSEVIDEPFSCSPKVEAPDTFEAVAHCFNADSDKPFQLLDPNRAQTNSSRFDGGHWIRSRYRSVQRITASAAAFAAANRS